MNDDIEARLRETLAERARRAALSADGRATAERIVAGAHAAASGPARRPRRAWLLPLVSAGAVAAIAGTIVGVAQTRHESAPQHRPAAPVQTSGPSTASPTPQPTGSTATPTAGPRLGDLTQVQARDLTFVGTNAWALATARCGGGSACAAVLRSVDGGASWTEAGPAPSGVEHLRFATATTGYAYGRDALYLTTNGGRTWQLQPGGALALETLSGNVIRVSTGCLPGCPIAIQTSPIGGTTWTTTDTIQPGMSPGVALVRTGHAAYVAVFGHTSGGAVNATTKLWTSSDDGAHWTDRGEPCPQSGDITQGGSASLEYDTTRIAAAPDGSLTALCTQRQASDGSASLGWQFTVTSTDGGHTFTAGARQALGSAPVSALAAASARVILVSSDDTYRSTDGGRSFTRLDAESGSSPGKASWLGFESATDGRAISADGRTLWTTHDAGATWTAHALP